MNATSTPSFGMAIKVQPEVQTAIKQLSGKQVKNIAKRFNYINKKSNNAGCDVLISLKKKEQPLSKFAAEEAGPIDEIFISKVVLAKDSDIPAIERKFSLNKFGGFMGGLRGRNKIMNDVYTQTDKAADLEKLGKFTVNA